MLFVVQLECQECDWNVLFVYMEQAAVTFVQERKERREEGREREREGGKEGGRVGG